MYFTKFFAACALLTIVSACTTTSSKVKTPNTETAGKVETKVPTEQAERLSDVYSRTLKMPVLDKTLPKVDANSVPTGKKIMVKMLPDFGRKFRLCDQADQCEEVIPGASVADAYNKSASTTNSDSADSGHNGSNIFGDVELSDKTRSLSGMKLPEVATGKRILIMDPDVELNLLTASGLQEPNALWTSAAKGYVTELSAQYFEKLGHKVTLYKDGANGIDVKTGQDLINLHESVGQSIFLYQYQGLFQLPTKKKGGFNWKLGKTARQLKEGYGADLGLFVYLRDSYSSGSRVAAQFLMAALFGAHVQGGQQVGFVSLVDMETGDIVWFNRLFSTTGDLRTFGAALNATDALLTDIPL